MSYEKRFMVRVVFVMYFVMEKATLTMPLGSPKYGVMYQAISSIPQLSIALYVANIDSHYWYWVLSRLYIYM